MQDEFEQQLEVDEHGYINIFLDDWSNLVCNDNESAQLVVEGSSLNILLRGLFIFFSLASEEEMADPDSFFYMPPGREAWKEISEVTLTTITSVATVEQVVVRIYTVVRLYFESEVKLERQLEIISTGALSFLNVWIKYFFMFLKSHELIELLVNIRLIQTYLLSLKSISSCKQTVLLQIVNPIYQLIQRHVLANNLPSQNQFVLATPYGQWDSAPEERKRELKEKRSKLPTPNITVFGVTPELLDHENDLENEMETFNPLELEESAPISRIPIGRCLLDDSSTVSIWNFDLIEIARQWTLIDHLNFCKIRLFDLSQCLWADARYNLHATEIRRFIDKFNAESSWVTESIVRQSNSNERAILYSRFVELAAVLESLHNFSGVMAILTALQQGCITRMTETLNCVEQSTHEKLRKLQNMMSANKNYACYRLAVQQRLNILYHAHWSEEWEYVMDSPTVNFGNSLAAIDYSTDNVNKDCRRGAVAIVPHLGSILSELCSIDEGNPNFLVEYPHLFNLTKRRFICRCLQQMKRFHKLNYRIQSINCIQTLLNTNFNSGRHLTAVDASQWSKSMYHMSLQLEGKFDSAKNADRTSIAHLSQNQAQSGLSGDDGPSAVQDRSNNGNNTLQNW